MTIAMVVAQRSLDQETKHGCVVVAEDNTILSMGYNSPPRGCDDRDVPQTRPEKYFWFEHAERNAIYNAAKHGISLKGATFYCTGHPCGDCFRAMMNVEPKKIVYGPIGSACTTEEVKQEIKKMAKRPGKTEVVLEEFNSPVLASYTIQEILKQTMNYMEEKVSTSGPSEAKEG